MNCAKNSTKIGFWPLIFSGEGTLRNSDCAITIVNKATSHGKAHENQFKNNSETNAPVNK